MRKGREFYSNQYDKVIELHNAGKSTKEIAAQLKISYSCVYHWINALRAKPISGALNELMKFLQDKGPSPVADIKKDFAKHNEFFLRAQSRKLPVCRIFLQRKFGDYATWYYLAGQEAELKARIASFIEKYNETRKKLAQKLEEIDFTELLKEK
jgi:hypothetical protein